MKWTVWATRGPEVFQTKRDHHAVWVVCPHKALLPLQLPEPTERWRAEVQYQLEGPAVSIFPMHIIVTKHKRDIIAEPCTLVTQHGSYLQLKEERITRNICWYLHLKNDILEKYKWCYMRLIKLGVSGWGNTMNIDQYAYDRKRPKWPTETNRILAQA